MLFAKAAGGAHCPHDYPKWQNCYKHYKIWKTTRNDGKSILDKALEELVISERVIAGRNPTPSLGVVDSMSVKNTAYAEKKVTMPVKKSQA